MAATSRTSCSPLTLGSTEIPCRVISTSHQTTLVHDHMPTADFVAYQDGTGARRGRSDHHGGRRDRAQRAAHGAHTRRLSPRDDRRLPARCRGRAPPRLEALRPALPRRSRDASPRHRSRSSSRRRRCRATATTPSRAPCARTRWTTSSPPTAVRRARAPRRASTGSRSRSRTATSASSSSIPTGTSATDVYGEEPLFLQRRARVGARGAGELTVGVRFSADSAAARAVAQPRLRPRRLRARRDRQLLDVRRLRQHRAAAPVPAQRDRRAHEAVPARAAADRDLARHRPRRRRPHDRRRRCRRLRHEPRADHRPRHGAQGPRGPRGRGSSAASAATRASPTTTRRRPSAVPRTRARGASSRSRAHGRRARASTSSWSVPGPPASQPPPRRSACGHRVDALRGRREPGGQARLAGRAPAHAASWGVALGELRPRARASAR